MQTLSDGIVYDTRTNGSGSLMRIHRDIRFSKDKTPYKIHISMMFWEGVGKKSENPGFGFRMDVTGGGVFSGMYGFNKPMLEAYRGAVADDKLGAELETTLESIRKAGDYEIGGEHYKRVPRGYDPEHKRADLLRYNTLYAHSPIDPAVLTTPDLVDVCFEHCRKMFPLQQWLVKVKRQTE